MVTYVHKFRVLKTGDGHDVRNSMKLKIVL